MGNDYKDYVDNLGQNSFVLYKLIRNGGKNCRGSGAAIMCYLIQSSRNKEKEFRPLKVDAVLDTPSLARYFESFGCKSSQEWWNVLDKYLYCDDPKPKRCEEYID